MHTDEYTQSERYYSLPISSNTHLMSIQEDEGVAPTSSPVLRSGRIVGGTYVHVCVCVIIVMVIVIVIDSQVIVLV